MTWPLPCKGNSYKVMTNVGYKGSFCTQCACSAKFCVDGNTGPIFSSLIQCSMKLMDKRGCQGAQMLFLPHESASCRHITPLCFGDPWMAWDMKPFYSSPFLELHCVHI